MLSPAGRVRAEWRQTARCRSRKLLRTRRIGDALRNLQDHREAMRVILTEESNVPAHGGSVSRALGAFVGEGPNLSQVV